MRRDHRGPAHALALPPTHLSWTPTPTRVRGAPPPRADDLWMGQAAEDITSAEVALVLLLEIPLGPLYVYAAFGELPPACTVVGAALLLLTLVGHGAIEAMHADGASSKLASTRSSPLIAWALPASASPTAGMGAVRRALSGSPYSWSPDLGAPTLGW